MVLRLGKHMEPSELASSPYQMDVAWDGFPQDSFPSSPSLGLDFELLGEPALATGPNHWRIPLDSPPLEGELGREPMDTRDVLLSSAHGALDEPTVTGSPPSRLPEVLGKARIEVRKKGNKRWKRECDDLDMIWLESRKDAILLDVPEHAFGELRVYATHKSSERLHKHVEATTMLEERHRREGSADGLVTVSLKNERDNNQFKVSTSKSNGQDPILCVIVSVKDGTLVAMSPVLAIYRHQKEFPAPLDARVREAFRVLLKEAQRNPATVITPEVTAASLQQCWKDICEKRNDADVIDHPCYDDLLLVLKPRAVWIGCENGGKWIDRGMWDPCKDRETQLAKVEEAVIPSIEERRNDDPRTIYCLPFLDMKHGTIMWFCWTDFEAAKRYFLPLRSRPPSNPDRNTWVVTTFNLLENEGRPPMLFKLPVVKAKESVPTK